MLPAALYARFSTDLQNERSIEDQLALCKAFAERQGYRVTTTYSDRARSGASMHGREGLRALLDAVAAGEVRAVIVEAFDRLSRDMADLATLHRTLAFAGVALLAVHDGTADTLTIGLRGIVGQLYREDGVKKIRRGMAGRVRAGKSAGGRAYGYCPVPGQIGALEIVPAEADIIRRVCALYVEGVAPREIARRLNAEGVTPPRGQRWSASTLNGNSARACGLLRNPLYGGEMIWNRTRMMRDPSTGRRVHRPNPESEWQRQAMPALAIVPASLWRAVQARKAERAGEGKAGRPRAPGVLSGLLRCGCGAGMSIHDRQGGRVRMRCSAAQESGTCNERRRIYADDVEQAVLRALAGFLAAPEIAEEYARAYNAELRRLAGDAPGRRAEAARQVAAAQQAIDRTARAVARGVLSEGEAREILPGLRAEKAALEKARDAIPPEPATITILPATARQRLTDVEAIATMLRAGEQNGGTGCADAAEPRRIFREMVETVTIQNIENRVEFTIAGDLGALGVYCGSGGALRRKTPNDTKARFYVSGAFRPGASKVSV